mmetsp:Transcript_85977/g.149970  ORF Transcript_85977/g.149970 Transcript_85977/m.149970 type:complete len:379 (-) Transcript_85977:460-1596(-)
MSTTWVDADACEKCHVAKEDVDSDVQWQRTGNNCPVTIAPHLVEHGYTQLTRTEQHTAATRIQALHRGRKIRQEMEGIKAANAPELAEGHIEQPVVAGRPSAVHHSAAGRANQTVVVLPNALRRKDASCDEWNHTSGFGSTVASDVESTRNESGFTLVRRPNYTQSASTLLAAGPVESSALYAGNGFAHDDNSSLYMNSRAKKVAVATTSSNMYESYQASEDDWDDDEDRATLRYYKGRLGPVTKVQMLIRTGRSWVGNAPQQHPKEEIAARVDEAMKLFPQLRLTNENWLPGAGKKKENDRAKKMKRMFWCFDKEHIGHISKEAFRALYARIIDELGMDDHLTLMDLEALLGRYKMKGDDVLSFDEFALVLLKILRW